MATSTVRNLADDVVRQLRIRAAEHGRSAEAEHREILRQPGQYWRIIGARDGGRASCRVQAAHGRTRLVFVSGTARVLPGQPGADG